METQSSGVDLDLTAAMFLNACKHGMMPAKLQIQKTRQCKVVWVNELLVSNAVCIMSHTLALGMMLPGPPQNEPPRPPATDWPLLNQGTEISSLGITPRTHGTTQPHFCCSSFTGVPHSLEPALPSGPGSPIVSQASPPIIFLHSEFSHDLCFLEDPASHTKFRWDCGAPAKKTEYVSKDLGCGRCWLTVIPHGRQNLLSLFPG